MQTVMADELSLSLSLLYQLPTPEVPGARTRNLMFGVSLTKFTNTATHDVFMGLYGFKLTEFAGPMMSAGVGVSISHMQENFEFGTSRHEVAQSYLNNFNLLSVGLPVGGLLGVGANYIQGEDLWRGAGASFGLGQGGGIAAMTLNYRALVLP